jgi:hypothetical protein
MTQLYTVHFTTKQIVSQFDAKGRKIGEYETDIAQTIHALPHSTALGYKKFGNFKMEPYYLSEAQRSHGASKAKTEYRGTVPSGKTKPYAGSSAVTAKSAAKSAAASGNLAAAINAGAK